MSPKFPMLIAITRAVSSSMGHCELTHIPRIPIDVAKAQRQHLAYEDALRSLGAMIASLPAESDLPDSVFVEDAAVVLDECAVIARPGAASRRGETESISAALAPYRKLSFIRAPGTIDGGDVLRIGRTIFAGVGGRTNDSAIAQMKEILGPYGYRLTCPRVEGCLHLKSAVTAFADDLLLINPAWAQKADFPGFHFIEVDPAEPSAANALRVGETLIYPDAFPQTRARLEAAGFRILAVDVSELAKAEGAVTCCSLIFRGK